MPDSTVLAAERLSRRRSVAFYVQAAAFLIVTILDLPTRASLPLLIV
jgi:hypothetical protein